MRKIDKNKLLDPFFDDINGYSLDMKQREIILNNSANLLIVAGAGSGKTLTIIGKIKYLTQKLNIKKEEILCISFTNETVKNLKIKLEDEIDVFTFHKLGLEILKDNHIFFQIASADLLEYLVDEYFESFIHFNNYEKYVIKYFQYYVKEDLNLEIIREKYLKLFVSYKKLIIKFISLIKCHDHGIKDLRKYLKKNKWQLKRKKKLKNKYFLLIMFDIYKLYLEELHSTKSIDFDMMISLASKVVKEHGMKRYYRYIIIDEFQDTSMVRYQLIKNILVANDSKLICVGDDFQSIYKFSGCTMDLFVNFKKYFDKARVMYMNNTYRNSKEIIKASYKFIIKNSYQLSKKLVSNKSIKNPLKIIYYTDSNYSYKFKNLLEYLVKEKKKEILVLGRCNPDIKKVYDKIDSDGYLDYKELNLRFLTVHKSKGLESDEVIILNLEDSLLGFPNKLEDDEVLKLGFSSREKYLYAEERRLFYVALTRTKNNVYLMVHKYKQSIFIKEIIKECIILDI